MQGKDRIRLVHMLEAAQEAVAFCSGAGRGSLNDDRKLALALVKLIEIIGEAAIHVSDETREALPDIPWRLVSGMRNRLIHAYFEIDLDVLWSTVITDLPPLVENLKNHFKGS